MSNKIILKKSSVITANNPKLPQPSDLEYGELAVNYADSHETITLKNSNNEIAQFKSKEYNDANYAPKTHEHPEYSPTGHTHSEYVSKEYVDGVIEDNELVVAGALNEFNDSLTLKAEIDHNHDDVYSPTGHTHVSSDITDRVVSGTRISSGTTGLVEGRAVYGYAAPINHSSTATTHGLSTTSKYGHVKISNGDVATVASSDGLVAGMDHTHSNYTERNVFEVWRLESTLGDIIWQAEEQSQDDEELLNTWVNNFGGSRVSVLWNDDPVQVETIVSMICLPSFEAADQVYIMDTTAAG